MCVWCIRKNSTGFEMRPSSCWLENMVLNWLSVPSGTCNDVVMYVDSSLFGSQLSVWCMHRMVMCAHIISFIELCIELCVLRSRLCVCVVCV